jgi:hypothetical protein
MPAGLANNLSNLQNSVAENQYIVIILVFLVIFFLIYLRRMFNTDPDYTLLSVSICLVVILAIIIASTFTDVLKEGHKQRPSTDTFAYLFNSPGAKNFIGIMALVLFVIFVYEVPEYDNNKPHDITDKITFGNNGLLSNRSVGVILVFIFALFGGYTIYSTTR